MTQHASVLDLFIISVGAMEENVENDSTCPLLSHAEHVHCIHLLNVSLCRVEGVGFVFKATLVANLIHMYCFVGSRGGLV